MGTIGLRSKFTVVGFQDELTHHILQPWVCL